MSMNKLFEECMDGYIKTVRTLTWLSAYSKTDNDDMAKLANLIWGIPYNPCPEEQQPEEKKEETNLHIQNIKKNECKESHNELPSQHPRLRRQVAICSLDNLIKKNYLDMNHESNFDVKITNDTIKKGKFRHSRARQMQAAIIYGCKLYPIQTQYPELWLDELSSLLGLRGYPRT